MCGCVVVIGVGLCFGVEWTGYLSVVFSLFSIHHNIHKIDVFPLSNPPHQQWSNHFKLDASIQEVNIQLGFGHGQLIRKWLEERPKAFVIGTEANPYLYSTVRCVVYI